MLKKMIGVGSGTFFILLFDVDCDSVIKKI